MKNFDQWTEELTRVAFVQPDEEDRKVLIMKTEDLFVEDDFEEE